MDFVSSPKDELPDAERAMVADAVKASLDVGKDIGNNPKIVGELQESLELEHLDTALLKGVSITVLGEEEGDLGYPEKWMAAYLGKLTRCCQNLDGSSANTVKYGMSQKDAGFVVLRNKAGKVLGQSFYWISANEPKILVLDSFETSGPGNEKYLPILMEILQQRLSKIGLELVVGSGGNTPKLTEVLRNPSVPRITEYNPDGRLYGDSSRIIKPNSETKFAAQMLLSNDIEALQRKSVEVPLELLLKPSKNMGFLKRKINSILENFSLERITMQDSSGLTPLHLAIKHHNQNFTLTIIKRMEALGVPDSDFCKFDKKSGETPLMLTVIEGLAELTEILLAKTTLEAINKKNKISGWSVLDYAIIRGDEKLALAIIKRMESLGALDSDFCEFRSGKESFLSLAIKVGLTDVAEKLLTKYTTLEQFNRHNQYYKNPLNLAIESDNTRLALAIIEKMESLGARKRDFEVLPGDKPALELAAKMG